jgi:hypothetical protein
VIRSSETSVYIRTTGVMSKKMTTFKMIIVYFQIIQNLHKSCLFWGSTSCCAYFIKVIRKTVSRNNSSRCLFCILYRYKKYKNTKNIKYILKNIKCKRKIKYKITYSYFIYNSVALVRKQTIPTERPPLGDEVSANFCGFRVLRGQRNGSSRP